MPKGLIVFVVSLTVAGLFSISAHAQEMGTLDSIEAIPALVQVTYSPVPPTVGSAITATIQIAATFGSTGMLNTYPVVQLDSSSTPLTLSPSSSTVWTATLGPFSQAGAHQLSVSVFVQNAQEAQYFQQQLTNDNQTLTNLNQQYSSNPTPALLQQIQQVQAQLNTDQAGLDSTSKLVGADVSSFSVQ